MLEVFGGMDVLALASAPVAQLRELNRMRNFLVHGHFDQNPFDGSYVVIHAAVRWDKARKVTSNDLYDFFHATDALPSCDAFFTEGPLANILKARHVRLDALYDCRVCATVTEALQYAASL